MKQFKYFALLFAILFTALAFTACGDDEDEVGQDQRLVGTWAEYKNVDENLATGETDTEIVGSPELFPIVFNADGTGYEANNQPGSQERYPFQWYTKGDKLTMTGEFVEIENSTYSVEGNELRLTYTYTDEEDGNRYRSTTYYKRID